MDNSVTTVVSLFSGYGGIELGLRRAIAGDVRTLAFVERDAFVCSNLVAKIEAGLLDPAPVRTDVKAFDGRPFLGLVDILTGGFPCQPFSTAGQRNADNDPRHLFPDVLRIASEMRPRLVFLENVEGLLSAKLSGDGWRDPAGIPVLLHVLRELERIGYEGTFGVFSAAETGAPHQRKRVFILAYLSCCDPRLPSELQRRKDSGGGGEEEPWPSRPGEEQHPWEPPRVVAYSGHAEPPGRNDFEEGQQPGGRGNARSEPPPCGTRCQTEPPVGGDADGASRRMDYAELCVSCDSRVDELRMLGNGVVPQTAEIAFRVLYGRILAESEKLGHERDRDARERRAGPADESPMAYPGRVGPEERSLEAAGPEQPSADRFFMADPEGERPGRGSEKVLSPDGGQESGVPRLPDGAGQTADDLF